MNKAMIMNNVTEFYWEIAKKDNSNNNDNNHNNINLINTISYNSSNILYTYNLTDDQLLLNYFDCYPYSTNNCVIIESTTPEPNFSEYLESLPRDRVGLLAFLFLFSFATVFGNSLVILAVIRERYLHTSTNYFITSLAVADCLVGLVVMPFSALYEVLENTWFFGTDWCDIWRSLDVLFSTASILNLCVISLDRYWAITDPFSYPMRMTRKRAAGLICAVWICSGAISFPAIVWWRAAREGEMPAYKCTFTEHLGYLVFSSTISFYLPLLVMVFTYCRIYRAAVIQTRSLKIGTKQVLMASGELQLTLRIHRGGTTREATHHRSHHHHSTAAAAAAVAVAHHRRQQQQQCIQQDQEHTTGNIGGIGSGNDSSGGRLSDGGCGTTTSTPEEPEEEPLSALHNNGLGRHRHLGGKNFSLSRKLAKFAKEKKAAKTLGIVMGVFIVCWLPFFVVNLLSGFCIQCIAHEEIVSAVVTWLGWINSSMNPVIYACWSRDFRRAFVRILCVCCPRKIRRKYQPTMRSKSQCHVAAMVAASTSVNYSSVNQFDSNRSIMRRQLSSCSSCSGSSSCGGFSTRANSSQRSRDRNFSQYSGCQSFHRHHYRHRSGRNNNQHQCGNINLTEPITINTTTTVTPVNTGIITTSAISSNVTGQGGIGNNYISSNSGTGNVKHCTFATTTTTIPSSNSKFFGGSLLRRNKLQQPKTQLTIDEAIINTHLPLEMRPSHSSDSSNSSSIRITD